jgi:4-amino-4-deoxy-L-arabinose transferase-like glycosyltransferase
MPTLRVSYPWIVPAALAGFCVLLFGIALERTPFRGQYDDVNRALIARTMADSGDWIVPIQLGAPQLTKPPLSYWLGAALYRLTGGRHELPAALVSVLCSLLVVLATYRAGHIMWSRRAGMVAALTLATTYLFFAMARQPLVDTVMMAGFALAFVSLIRLIFGPPNDHTVHWVLLATGVGLATMAKGPVILPLLLIMAIPPLVNQSPRFPNWPQLTIMLVVFILMVFPYHFALLRVQPEAHKVWAQELWRLGSQYERFAWTQRPWWYYFANSYVILPWLPLVVVGLVRAIRHRDDLRLQLLLWWIVGGIVFFSLFSANKRVYYLLPLCPAIALLCASVWEAAAQSRSSRAFTRAAKLTAVFVLMVGVASASLPSWTELRPSAVFVLVGLAGASMAIWSLVQVRRQRWIRAFGGLIIASSVLYLLYAGAVLPPWNLYLSEKPFYEETASLVGSETFYTYKLPVVLSAFYMERHGPKLWTLGSIEELIAQGDGGYLLTRPQYVRQLDSLELVYSRTSRSPLGVEKEIALYRLPQRYEKAR